MTEKLSIIIPVLDEAERLTATLAALAPFRARGHETLVVDGGSRDGSITIARREASRALMSGPGYTAQMNTGATFASHDVLLFMEVGVELPAEADDLVLAGLEPAREESWGFFELRGKGIGGMMGALTRWPAASAGIASQGQPLYVTRSFFERTKGFENWPGQENEMLSRKLLQTTPPRRFAVSARKIRPA